MQKDAYSSDQVLHYSPADSACFIQQFCFLPRHILYGWMAYAELLTCNNILQDEDWKQKKIKTGMRETPDGAVLIVYNTNMIMR